MLFRRAAVIVPEVEGKRTEKKVNVGFSSSPPSPSAFVDGCVSSFLMCLDKAMAVSKTQKVDVDVEGVRRVVILESQGFESMSQMGQGTTVLRAGLNIRLHLQHSEKDISSTFQIPFYFALERQSVRIYWA